MTWNVAKRYTEEEIWEESKRCGGKNEIGQTFS